MRCINNIIKPWNEVWALGKGSKDDFLHLKLMREISPMVATLCLLMTALKGSRNALYPITYTFEAAFSKFNSIV